MTKEEVIQNAKDAVKKVYPNAEFIDKHNFTPAPIYFDTFAESVVEKVFYLASFGICVRKNETPIDEQIIEAKNKVGECLSDEYIIDFIELGEPFEPIFDFKLPLGAEEAIRFLAKNGIQTTVLLKPTKDQEQEIRDTIAKYKPISYADRLSEAASQFNDALLDEQSRKIADLEERLKKADSDYMDKVHLASVRGKEIARLNKVIHEKNMMIKNLILERGRVARLLAAEQTTHKIDLQATTSAESALIYKEKEFEKSLQEKDEVIDDLSRELAHSKEREEELMATIKDYLTEIDELKKSRRGEIRTMKELLKKIENAANKAVDTENTAAARYAKKAMSERVVFPKSRIVVFSSRSPRNNFLDELRKSFFED